jgi:signal transduction histidine kinase
MSVSDFPPSRARRPLALFALQAAVWATLTFAFAALLVLVSPFEWADALGISAVNWIPWVALTPIIFWLSRRFPLERGRLLRSVPIHFVAALLSTVISLTVTAAVFAPPRAALKANAGGPNALSGPRPPRPFARDASGAVLPHRRHADDGRERSPLVGPGSLDANSKDARPLDFRYEPRLPNARPGDLRGPFPGGGEFRGPFPRGGPQPATGFGSTFFAPLNPLSLRGNFGFAMYLILMAGAHALAYYRRAQDRDRDALALTAHLNQARLDALRLQLQPHFLFNTLHAISTLVHRDPDAADELISDLGGLLRASLENKDHEVPLAREIELLDRYLAIEQTRLGDRLRIVRDIDSAAATALVPTFLLQPLAENAIRHGLEPRTQPGTLTISARREGDDLHLSVTDDGVGLATPDARTARQGIGLSNSKERLRALHNGRARLELSSPPTGGARVEVVLPFLTERAVAATTAPA